MLVTVETTASPPTPAPTLAPGVGDAPAAPAVAAAPVAPRASAPSTPTLLAQPPEAAPPAETKPAETPAEKPAEPKAEAPPIELKLPEGAEAKSFEPFKALAKELGLDSPKAQKLLDLYSQQTAASQKAFVEQSNAQQKQWVDAVRADPELGAGKPETFTATVDVARRAIKTYGTPALAQLLEESGIGDHPEVVRFAARIGRALSEDTVAGTQSAQATQAQGQEQFLRQMYPTMFAKE